MIRSITILIVLAVCLGSSAITHAKDTKHLGLLERLETSHVSSIENYILDQILEKIQTSKQTTDIGKDEKKDKIDKRLRRNRRLEGSTPTSAPVKHKKSNEKTHKKTTTTESSGSMSSSSGSSSSSSSNSSGSSSSSSNTFTSSGNYSEAVTSTPTLSYINGQSYSFVPFLSVAIAIGMMVVAAAFIRRDGGDDENVHEHQLKGSVHKRMQMFSNYMADMDGRSVDSDLLPSRRKGPLKKLGKSLRKLFPKRKQGSVSSDSVSDSSGIYSQDETTTSVLVV